MLIIQGSDSFLKKNKKELENRFFEEIVVVVSELLIGYEDGYTFEFTKSEWNETYKLFVIDDSYRDYHLELSKQKVQILKQQSPHALQDFIQFKLKRQGFPINDMLTKWNG